MALPPGPSHLGPRSVDPILDRGDHYRVDLTEARPDGWTRVVFDQLAALEAARPGRTLRLLLDIRNARYARPGSEGTVRARFREFESRRVAVVGASAAQEAAVRVLLLLTGLSTVRYFSDEDAALAWLRSDATSRAPARP